MDKEEWMKFGYIWLEVYEQIQTDRQMASRTKKDNQLMKQTDT